MEDDNKRKIALRLKQNIESFMRKIGCVVDENFF